MGWCSGTEIFDSTVSEILDTENKLSPEVQTRLITALVKALYAHDWDCEGDSRYWDTPIVDQVFRELNPDIDYDETWENAE